jgi:molecular chaperone GrpE
MTSPQDLSGATAGGAPDGSEEAAVAGSDAPVEEGPRPEDGARSEEGARQEDGMRSEGGARSEDVSASDEADLLGAPGISEELATTAAADEMFAEAEGIPAPPEGLEDQPPPDVSDPAAVAASLVAQERDDYRDALVRLQADFENYKKRVAKQQEDLRQRAAETLVEKLLPVLDTADLALSHGGGEDVKQIWAALYGALEKEGLERIDDPGSPFDPTLHDAVAHEPGDEGPQEVVEVLRAGYRWRGRVLRPAMVKVRG